MIGMCPNCKIELKKPPFNIRETNEVILTLKYRKKIEGKEKIISMNELGYCEICKATKKDMKEQKRNAE